MSNNRKIWLFVGVVVFVTLSFTLGSAPGHTQQTVAGKPTPDRTPDFSKYPVADLAAPEPTDSPEGRLRALKNKRYDKHPLILSGLNPRDTAVRAFDAEPTPSALSVAESRLIVAGRILGANAFVSGNRKGVYTEYSLQIQSIIKNDRSADHQVGDIIGIDRSGGMVRYPSGQKVMYFLAGQGIPETGGNYIAFLNKEGDDENPNYKIITIYQLKGGQVFPVDSFPSGNEMKGLDQNTFISRITNLVKQGG
jgi:hypothetical protein